MTATEFSNIVKGMKAVYTDPKFLPDEDAINVWFALFADDDYKVTQAAVLKYMQTNKFPPTPAGIREQITNMTTLQPVGEEEAWQLVIRAVRNSGYHAAEEFAQLPETVQRAVVSPSHLHDLSQMPSETVHSVEKSHFFRVYRTEVERKKETSMIPQKLREMITQTSQRMIGGTS